MNEGFQLGGKCFMVGDDCKAEEVGMLEAHHRRERNKKGALYIVHYI